MFHFQIENQSKLHLGSHIGTGRACICIEAPGSRTRCCDHLCGLIFFFLIYRKTLSVWVYGKPIDPTSIDSANREQQKGTQMWNTWEQPQVGSTAGFCFSNASALRLGGEAKSSVVGDCGSTQKQLYFALDLLISTVCRIINISI